jgi:hypothetical protein
MNSKETAVEIKDNELDKEKQNFSVKFIENIENNDLLPQFFSELENQYILNFLKVMGNEDASSYFKKPKKRIDAYIQAKRPVTNFRKYCLSDGEACQDLLDFWFNSTISRLSEDFTSSISESDGFLSISLSKKKIANEGEAIEIIIDIVLSVIRSLVEHGELHKACYVAAGVIADPGLPSIFDPKEQNELLNEMISPSVEYLEGVIHKVEEDLNRKNYSLKYEISDLKSSYTQLGEKFLEACKRLIDFNELPPDDLQEDTERLKNEFYAIKEHIGTLAEEKGLNSKQIANCKTPDDLTRLLEKLEHLEDKILEKKIAKALSILDQAKQIEVNGSQEGKHLITFFKKVDSLKKTIPGDKRQIENVLLNTHPVSILINYLQVNNRNTEDISQLQQSLEIFCGADTAYFIAFNILTGKMSVIGDKGKRVKENLEHREETIQEPAADDEMAEGHIDDQIYQNESPDETACDQKQSQDIVEEANNLVGIEKAAIEKKGGKDDADKISQGEIATRSNGSGLELESSDEHQLSSKEKDLEERDIAASPNDPEEIFPIPQVLPEGSRDKLYFEKCLENGEFRKAYWIAVSCDVKIPSDLMGAVAIGTQIGIGSSLPAQLQSFFSNILANKFEDASSKLLLVSAIAASILFTTPPSNELFTLVELVECGVKPFDRLVQFLKSEFLYKGATIRPNDVNLTLGNEELEQNLQELQEKSSELLLRNRNSYFTGYVPAQMVLRHLYREGSDLTSIHRAIERNDISREKEIQSLLKKLSAETIIEDAHTLGVSKVVTPIEGKEKRQLMRRVNDTIAIGREWHSIVVKTSLGINKIEKERILVSLKQHIRKAIDSLVAFVDKDVEENVICVANKSLTLILNQLDGNQKSDIIPNNYEVLGIESLVLDDDFEIESDSEICIVDCFETHSITDKGIDPCIFDTFLSRREFYRAKQILEILSLDQQYSDRLEQRISEEHSRISKRINVLQNKVEDAYLLGRLDFEEKEGEDQEKGSQDALRSKLSGKLSNADSQIQSSSETIAWRVREIESTVDIIEIQLSQMEHRHNDKLMGEFRKILVQFPDSESGREDRNYVETAFKEAFSQGDNIAAFELINRAKEVIQEKIPFPRTSIGENSELTYFLKKLDTYQKLLGKKSKLGVKISLMKQRKTVAGIEFKWVDKAHLDTVVNGLSTWRDLLVLNYQKSENVLISKLETIANFLDFGVKKKSVIRKSSIDDDFVYFTAGLNFPIECCPIPTFGSSMGKKIHIVLSQNKKEPSQLDTFLRRHKLQNRPVFLFYLQEMGINQRKIYQQFFAKTKVSVLLIDLCLSFHLCGIRNRLPALFRISLPFSWAQPYLMKGENVPHETFVGRDEEVKSLHDPNGSCIVFGGRQLGKSALLRHVYNTYNNPNKGEYIAYLDIDGLGMDPQTHDQMKEEFWRKVHAVLCREKFLTDKEIGAKKGAKKVEDEVVGHILDTLQENPDKYLYLLLDETDCFLDNDSSLHFPIIRQLRGMMATTGRRFKVILAGLQSVQRYKNWKNHPFAQLGTALVVRPLNPEPAQKLILNPLHALGFVFEKTGLILRILSQANYHPGLIQIFCHRLIEKMYIKWGNRASDQIVRTIDIDDLLTIERDPNFIEDIRNRFDWTLDLDDRYKVLVYSLVLTEDPTSSCSEREFMDRARSWWPVVFDKMDQQQLRAVLDEMDGLGVLVREDEGTKRMYRLRSPNLLRLLGTPEQIEDELQRIISLDKPRIVNSRNFHSKISEKPILFGPMTKEQEGQISNELNTFGITIISGSIALGLDVVPEQIKSVFAEVKEWREIKAPSQYNAAPEKFISFFKDGFKSRNGVNKYVIVDLAFFPSGFNISVFALNILETLGKICTKNNRGHIFLLMDPQHSWNWLGESEHEAIIQHNRVNSIELKRWSNGAITNALENLGILARAKANGEDIFAITFGWHNLINIGLQSIYESSKSKGKKNIIKIWEKQIDILDHKIKATPVDILKEFGLTLEKQMQTKALKNVFDLSSSEPDVTMTIGQEIFDYVRDEDEEIAQLFLDGGRRVREWLQMNDIVYRTRDGQLEVNQVARNIILNGLLTQ